MLASVLVLVGPSVQATHALPLAQRTVGRKDRTELLHGHLGRALARRERLIDDGDGGTLLTDALDKKRVPTADVGRPALGAGESLEDLVDPDCTALNVLVEPLHDGHVLADRRVVPRELPRRGRALFVNL